MIGTIIASLKELIITMGFRRIKYYDIYSFYYEKCLLINTIVLGALLALFIFTCIMGQRSAVSKFIWRITAILSFFTLLYITILSREPGSIGDESLKYLFPYFHGDKKKIEPVFA